MLKIHFRVIIFTDGSHTFSCYVQPNEYNMIGSILTMFPIVSELHWFKSEVLKAKSKGTREYTGLNTFECHVTGDICEVFHDYDQNNIQEVPTDAVLEFIDEAIKFHELYDSGGIPGIIPKSKKNDWIIVPKQDWIMVPRQYVKDEYWDSKTE